MLIAAFSSQLPFTALLNRILGGAVTLLLGVLGIHPHDPQAPIPNFVAMQILVALLLVSLFLIARSGLSVENPGKVQHLAEFIYGFFKDMGHQLIGHGYEPVLPFLITLGLFILTCNLLGLVPTLESPTANPSVPLGCAMMSFCYYNFQGIRQHGFSYIKQFLGPVIFLSPLVGVIEIISHLARMLSLTVRLYANIFAGDMLTLAFFSLIPIGVPVVFQGLHLMVSLIQTYIFVLLSTVYLSQAMEEAH